MFFVLVERLTRGELERDSSADRGVLRVERAGLHPPVPPRPLLHADALPVDERQGRAERSSRPRMRKQAPVAAAPGRRPLRPRRRPHDATAARRRAIPGHGAVGAASLAPAPSTGARHAEDARRGRRRQQEAAVARREGPWLNKVGWIVRALLYFIVWTWIGHDVLPPLHEPGRNEGPEAHPARRRSSRPRRRSSSASR